MFVGSSVLQAILCGFPNWTYWTLGMQDEKNI